MIAKIDLDYDILIESEKNDIDYHYALLKKNGWFDFIDDFVTPSMNEDGVRIDVNLNYPRTIRTDSITCENTLNLIGQLKFIRNL